MAPPPGACPSLERGPLVAFGAVGVQRTNAPPSPHAAIAAKGSLADAGRACSCGHGRWCGALLHGGSIAGQGSGYRRWARRRRIPQRSRKQGGVRSEWSELRCGGMLGGALGRLSKKQERIVRVTRRARAGGADRDAAMAGSGHTTPVIPTPDRVRRLKPDDSGEEAIPDGMAPARLRRTSPKRSWRRQAPKLTANWFRLGHGPRGPGRASEAGRADR